MRSRPQSTADPTSSPIFNEVFTSLFYVFPEIPKEQYPGLPLLMRLVVTAVGRREVIYPDWEGRQPNDHGILQTDFYRTSPHFGTLFKFHGSLNWLYCKTCRSLDFGAWTP